MHSRASSKSDDRCFDDSNEPRRNELTHKTATDLYVENEHGDDVLEDLMKKLKDENQNSKRLLLMIASQVADGHELLPDALEQVQESANGNGELSLYWRYVLCAHVAQQSGFIEPAFFGNLSELLATNDAKLRQSIMWAFASILPCKNILSSLLVRLLYNSLKSESLGWSISHLFRKISEDEKYASMLANITWLSMGNLLFDVNLSEQVRTTIVYTLYNIYKIRKWISPLIKMKLEKLLRMQDIPQRIFIATVHTLHSMVISGASLEQSTLTTLKSIMESGSTSSIESIRDLLDFLDNRRILSKMVSMTSDSCVRKELTATQNTTVSRSEEESVEPTAKFLNIDNLLGKQGHLDRQFNAENQPHAVRSGDNTAWYRTTLQEIDNMATLAEQGELKDQDFQYLAQKFDTGLHWGWTAWKARNESLITIAKIFLDVAKYGQILSNDIIRILTIRLTDDEVQIRQLCSETLLTIVKNQQMLSEHQIKAIEEKLQKTNDAKVKEHLIELYGIFVSKGYQVNLDLTAIENDLKNGAVSEAVSYLFFKAAAVYKRTFEKKTLLSLISVATSNSCKETVRDNCLSAVAYSIKGTEDKVSIDIEVINELATILSDSNESLQQTAAVGLCYYAMDDNVTLNQEILESFTSIFKTKDSTVLNNIVCIYLKITEKGSILSSKIMTELQILLKHSEFVIRETTIWIFKYNLKNGAQIERTILDNIESCVSDDEFSIRDTAASIMLAYWSNNLVQYNSNFIVYISSRIEQFVSIVFRQSFSLEVQVSSLKVLRKLVQSKCDLSEAVFTLLECCLYDREESISSSAIDILESYTERNSLPKTTLVCLEHILNTETKILPKVIKILTKIVRDGHILSKNAVEILGQFLSSETEPKSIETLLMHADRNQPVPKNINELLRQIYFVRAFSNARCPRIIEKAYRELFTLTSQGKLLCKWCFDTLVSLLQFDAHRSNTLRILVNVVSNGQCFSKAEHRKIIEEILLESFADPSTHLMEILAQLSRQNQIIPSILTTRSTQLLSNSAINHFVIEIYQHSIERQKQLDSEVFEKVFVLFNRLDWAKFTQTLRQRLIGFIKAVANNRPQDMQQQKILFLLDNTYTTNVRQGICQTLKTLAESRIELESNTIKVLLNLLNNEDDTDIQDVLLETLDFAQKFQPSMNIDLTRFLDLIRCDPSVDDRNLLKMVKHVIEADIKLPNSYLIRLSHMLYSCDIEVRQEAAYLLVVASSKLKQLPQSILDIIYLTLLDENVNVNTISLLLKQTGKLSSTVIDDLILLATKSTKTSLKNDAENILKSYQSSDRKVKEFLENKLTLIEAQYERDSRLKVLVHSQEKDKIVEAFRILRAIVLIEKRLDYQLVQDIVSLLHSHQDQIVEILILMDKQQISFDQVTLRSIEESFIMKPTNKFIGLIQRFSEKQISFQDKTLRSLWNSFTDRKLDDALMVLETIAQYQTFPIDLIQNITEKMSEQSETITDIYFSIIRHQISRGYSEYQEQILTNIKYPYDIDREKRKQITDLSLVETLLFVDHFDPSSLDLDSQQWSRQCLCVDIISFCQEKSIHKIMEFYKNLTEFEQFKGYKFNNEKRDLFLRTVIKKQRQECISLSIINEILIYAKTKTDQPLKIIQSDRPAWRTELRVNYIQEKLEESPKDGSDSSLMIKLLSNRISQYENLSAGLIQVFLTTINSTKNALQYLELLEKYQVTTNELIQILCSREASTNFDSLIKSTEFTIILTALRKRWPSPEYLLKTARTYLKTLLHSGWTVKKILVLISSLKTKASSFENLKEFIAILKSFIDYEIDEKIVHSLTMKFTDNQMNSLASEVNALMIEHRFGSSSSEKNLAALLNEIKKCNEQIDTEKLKNIYQLVEKCYQTRSDIFDEKTNIRDFRTQDITTWAKKVRNDPKNVSREEILAVIKRGVFLDSNYEPRTIQLLAIIINLETSQSGGRILQILTGEGKSTVVSMLAVVKALENRHVDIITSAMTLAKRDVIEKQSFYKLFGLNVAHNNDETSYTSGPKACYANDIVYGTSSQFQFDLLRHEFSLLNTRCLNKQSSINRRFDVVIIDEVDSMLIDENSTIARLADQLYGVEWINPLFYGIWQSLPKESELLNAQASLVENYTSFLTDPNCPMKIPTHLYEFVLTSIPTWIDHAIRAKVEYRLDHHYMIKADETRTKRIMPVDFSNTGIVQSSTTWSDGLHQFLQIKHGLKMTPLTVTTNYLSNVGLFTRYKGGIYGLTGTIGSKDAEKLLLKIYDVDTIIIPPFREKRHIQLKTIIKQNDEEWLETVVSDTLDNSAKGRAILIICETRINAKEIRKQLQRSNPRCMIRMYTDNTDTIESNAVGSLIQQGEILVATNLAGRGTDLKTSDEVERQGGLHVCLTFLPNNLRVEEQAFGRTSRQGNRGTSQMILSQNRTIQQLLASYSNYVIDQTADINEQIRTLRSIVERKHLDRILEKEIVEIKSKDELFQRFCTLLSRLREKNNDAYRLSSAKERWGLWLKSMDYLIQGRTLFYETLKAYQYDFTDTPRDTDSFFHAISDQLDGTLTVSQVKDQVVQHILENKASYTIINDEARHLATSRQLNLNLYVFRSDSCSWKIYESDNTEESIYLGYEVGSHYVSLKPWTEAASAMDSSKKGVEQKQSQSKFSWMLQKVKNVSLNTHDKKEIEAKLATKVIEHDRSVSFEQFIKKLENEYSKNDLFQNPCYLMLGAEEMINKLSSWSNTFRSCVDVLPLTDKKAITPQQVLEQLQRAIEIDPIFAFGASVNEAFLAIQHKKSESNYKLLAKSKLVYAQEQINKYILPQLTSMQVEQKKIEDEFVYDELNDQIKVKIEIIQLYLNHIAYAITVIEESQKLIDVAIRENDCVTIGEKLYRDEVQKFFSKSSDTFDMSFRNLSVFRDVFKKDQALNLFSRLPKNHNHITIQFLDGKEQTLTNVSEKMTPVMKISLNVEYLDTDEVLKLIENRLADLSIISKPSSYVKAIELFKSPVTLIVDNIRLESTWDDAVNYLNTNGDKVKSICFKAINSQRFIAVSSKVKDAAFGLTFSALDINTAKSIARTISKPFTFEIRDLNVSQAKKFIDQIEERNFILTIHQLDKSTASKLISGFSENEEEISVTLKLLIDHFSKNDQPYQELNTYRMLGINTLISVDKLSPRPWISVSITVGLGIGQIVAGVCLTAVTCGIGVSLGISSIGEGVNDIIFAVKGAICRRFSWQDYAIQKAVSLSICFVSLGFSAVSQGAQAVKAAGKAGGTNVMKGTWNIVKTSFKTIGSDGIKTTATTSWGLATKQVLVTLGENGLREVTNYATDTAVSGAMASIKSAIREQVDIVIKEKYETEEFSRIMISAATVDAYRGTRVWQNCLEEITTKILTKKQNETVEALKSFTKGATNAFLNTSRQYLQTTSTGGGNIATALNCCHYLMTLLPMLIGSHKLATICNNFLTAYGKELMLSESKIPKFHDLLIEVSNSAIPLEDAVQIQELLVVDGILTKYGRLNIEFSHDEESDRFVGNKGHFSSDPIAKNSTEWLKNRLFKIQFTSDLHKQCAQDVLQKLLKNKSSITSIDQFRVRAVDMLTQQVILIIQGAFISPITNLLTAKLTVAISTKAQLLVNPKGTVTEQLMEAGAQRYINVVVNEWYDKVQRGEIQLSTEDREKVREVQERMAKGEEPQNQTEELAMKALSGENGGVIEASILAMISKKPLSVTKDDKNDESSSDSGIDLVYKPPYVDEATGKTVEGHYEPADGSSTPATENDCMYEAIKNQTGDQFKSVDDMRSQCAAFILANPEFIIGIHPALVIINQTRCPLRRKELLEVGGAKKPPIETNQDVSSNNKFEKAWKQKKKEEGWTRLSPEDEKSKKVSYMKQWANQEIIENARAVIKDWGSTVKQSTLADAIAQEVEKQINNFYQQNEADQVVEIKIEFQVKNTPFTGFISINADPPNPSEHNPQPNHFGCTVHIKGMDGKVSMHKYLPEGTIQNTRPVMNTPEDGALERNVSESTVVSDNRKEIKFNITTSKPPPPQPASDSDN